MTADRRFVTVMCPHDRPRRQRSRCAPAAEILRARALVDRSLIGEGYAVEGFLQARMAGSQLTGTSREWWDCLPVARATACINRIAVRQAFREETLRRPAAAGTAALVRRRARASALALAKRLLHFGRIARINRTLTPVLAESALD